MPFFDASDGTSLFYTEWEPAAQSCSWQVHG